MEKEQENRRERRSRTLKSGRIIFNGGYSALTCIIRNTSESGAMIEVVNLLGIPHEFELEIEPAPPRPCRVAWRRQNRLGVYFVTREGATAQRAERGSPALAPMPFAAEAAPEDGSVDRPVSPATPLKPAARVKRALAGLWPPAATPFRDDGSVDTNRLLKHCRRLLDDGAHGLAVLGTTSEANSLTLDERRRVIDSLIRGGIEAEKLLPGVGACALDDAVSLTRHAGDIGAAGVLLLPPFYYKKVSDEGLYAFVSRLVDRAGSHVPRILLYHIPPIATVGWSLELIGRLIAAFPGVVVGMKDSSGDFENTKRVIEAHPGFVVFPGAEVNLVKAMTAGAAGCISATANVNTRGIRTVFDRWMENDAALHQNAANAVRAAVEKAGMIPALKAILATRYNDAAWHNVREPLMPLTRVERAALFGEPAIAQLLEPVTT